MNLPVIAGALRAIQSHVDKRNREETQQLPDKLEVAETNACSCSAVRVLFLGGCKCN